MFETLKPLPPDAILGIMTLFRADQHAGKIDLSVGVYQDEQGRTPVLASVKRAEKAVIDAQDSKTYVAIAGNAGFNRGVEELVYGANHPALKAGRVATVQTPGGSGGLSVAGHLLARARPGAKVYLSEPTWPNHFPLLTLAGLTLDSYPYYDLKTHRVDFDAMKAKLETAKAGEIVLLHGCCHNPCGADLSKQQWQDLAALCERRGLVPLVDLAYQGLAEGLDEDAYGARLMAERLPEVVVVTSCSKNLGLYRERVGSATFVSATREQSQLALANTANVARGLYSMPPDHGAAIAAKILHDAELRALWVKELEEMRGRLNGLRRLLVDKLAARKTPTDFSFIAKERGMFSFLGIKKEQVIRLREQFHVYMIESSRINVAGVNRANVDYLADSIAAVLK
ncbi:MAG TPA: amino acid aminotransferase [Gammaproteobacteria bacterium]|nr:amino acid aminotransferase [Gammaproteobacteria bacterium]